jgi:uncharacterized membrane protein (UPF0182 family)
VVTSFVGAFTFVSYYVEALWFASLGYGDVFWRTLGLKAAVFSAFALVTFIVLAAAFRALRPTSALGGQTFIVNGQPVTFSLAPVLALVVWGIPLIVAIGTGLTMMAEWPTFALYWNAPADAAGAIVDPILGRPVNFYLFALPVWGETPFFSERERAALLWAEQLTLIAQSHVPDDVFALVRPHFTDQELADLMLLIGTINAWNRFGISFRDVPGNYKPAK